MRLAVRDIHRDFKAEPEVLKLWLAPFHLSSPLLTLTKPGYMKSAVLIMLRIVGHIKSHRRPGQPESQHRGTPNMPKNTADARVVHRINAGAGHRLHVAEYGSLDGTPVVVFHGGPGSGCNPRLATLMPLESTRIVLVDQRGAGRSVPRGGLRENDTRALVADAERIRIFLGIRAWTVVGGSWGASLAIAYAGTNPDAVTGLVLRATFLTGKADLEWYFGGLKNLVPQAWREFSRMGGGRSGLRLLEWYGRSLMSGSHSRQLRAAAAWARYDESVLSVCEGNDPGPTDPVDLSDAGLERLRAKYRIQAHYLLNRCFLGEGEVLRLCKRIAARRAIVLHGTLDLVCRPGNALKVAAAIPKAELRWVPGAGHAWSGPAMAGALRRAVADVV